MDVVSGPALDAHVVVGEEHEDGHADVGVHIGGGSIEGGHKSQKVLHGNEQEQTHQNRKDLASIFAHVGDGKVFKPADEQLEGALQLAGYQRKVAPYDPGEDEKDEHGRPGIENMSKLDDLSGDGDMIEMNQFGKENRFWKSACHECAP